MPQVEADNWYGLVAPTATPEPILAKLHAAAVEALHSAEVKDKLAAQGVIAVGNSSRRVYAYVKSEIERWGKVIATRHQDQVSGCAGAPLASGQIGSSAPGPDSIASCHLGLARPFRGLRRLIYSRISSCSRARRLRSASATPCLWLWRRDELKCAGMGRVAHLASLRRQLGWVDTS